ncbi:MAG: GemA protein [Methylomonas sp.]|nr:MAG: GemA protein [Methylomonas sp.]
MSNHALPHYKADARRRAALAKIHIGTKMLGMDDDTYRAMLMTLGGVKSSKDLTSEGINSVIRHLEKSGAVFKQSQKHGRKPNTLPSQSDRVPKLKKIEALLAEAGRPWGYAEAMAQHMYKKEKLEFCSHDELAGIIAGLVKNAKREGRRTS